jgi:hypothetical protein
MVAVVYDNLCCDMYDSLDSLRHLLIPRMMRVHTAGSWCTKYMAPRPAYHLAEVGIVVVGLPLTPHGDLSLLRVSEMSLVPVQRLLEMGQMTLV